MTRPQIVGVGGAERLERGGVTATSSASEGHWRHGGPLFAAAAWGTRVRANAF